MIAAWRVRSLHTAGAAEGDGNGLAMGKEVF